MSSNRFAVAAFALIISGCAEVDSLEFVCHEHVTDGGTSETDGGGGSGGSACPSPDPLDVCDVSVEGKITNNLDGTCWWEQCRDGERSLFMKPPGVPCVYRYKTGDFAIGSCDMYGVCTDGSGTGQPN